MIAWCRRSGRETLAALVVLVGLLIALAHVTGCAAFRSAMPYLPTPKTLACVADDLEKGVENPITIVNDCPELASVAAADVEALVMDLLMAKRAQHEAARRAGVALCAPDGGAADAADAGK